MQRGHDQDLQGWFSAVPGRGGEEFLRGAETEDFAGLDLHSLPARLAPGPPVGVRIDLEHLARSPDFGVRNTQVRRRFWYAQLFCGTEGVFVPGQGACDRQ